MVKAKPKPKGRYKANKSNQARNNQKNNKKNHEFEPRILAFCCNWCSYAGADLAGVSRVQYPPNIRIVRVMCSGRIEPSHIFAAFEAGADGVIVSGCHPGDCHYISGNLHAEEMIHQLKKLLNIIGFDDRRLRLQWVSASEGQLFADYITEFVELIKKLGPSPLINETSKPEAGLKSGTLEKSRVNKIGKSGKAVVSA
jgi:F420-non-reducing hydrogenase iron-sulfur subunit